MPERGWSLPPRIVDYLVAAFMLLLSVGFAVGPGVEHGSSPGVITFAVMFAVALAVGFRVEGTFVEAVYATLLLFGFSYAFCWIQALIGLSVKTVEAANSAGFIWMFPLTFISSAFVDSRLTRRV